MQDFTINSEFVQKFDQELGRLIAEGSTGQLGAEVFNGLALKEFFIQYNSVPYYREECRHQGVTPENIQCWDEIPPLHSAVFKQTVIAGFPLHETELTVMTSGTSNPNNPSKIYRDKRSVDLCYQANVAMAKNFLFPDVDRMKILLMVPSPKIAPAMGMAVGMEQLRQNFGTADSTYLITPEGMEWERLFQALSESQQTGVPVAIVGATSGLVYFFNFCREQQLRFALPPGSRICDGGGYLGTFGDCTREQYYQLCMEVLGVPEEYCVNTLGSGESATNYFDNALRNHFLGLKGVPRFKVCPSWARTVVVDPLTGLRQPMGKVGLLRHYDLMNRSNVLAVQTNNLGYETEAGFEIIGRADAAGKAASTTLNVMISGEKATCSTVATEMLAGEQPTCSTVATEMLTGEQPTCSTVATEMLTGEQATCSTVATEMLTGQRAGCSTVATDMLAHSPHGTKFNNISAERLARLKQLCPFLKMQQLFKKA